MTIMAFAPVPANNNLAQGDTVEFPMIPRPRPAGDRLDWFGNPITAECTVTWCTGDCVMGGSDELGHHRTLVDRLEVADGVLAGETRHVLALLQQSQAPDLPGGFAEPTVYLSTGDSDAYGVELTIEQAEQIGRALVEAARLAGVA